MTEKKNDSEEDFCYSVITTKLYRKEITMNPVSYTHLSKNTRDEEIKKFAEEKFGHYSGLAQQYLFFYARENKIGK